MGIFVKEKRRHGASSNMHRRHALVLARRLLRANNLAACRIGNKRDMHYWRCYWPAVMPPMAR